MTAEAAAPIPTGTRVTLTAPPPTYTVLCALNAALMEHFDRSLPADIRPYTTSTTTSEEAMADTHRPCPLCRHPQPYPIPREDTP